MEIRLSGKNDNQIGYKSMSAWIRTTKDKRRILVIKLGELQISIYPFDSHTVSKLGQKLKDIV